MEHLLRLPMAFTRTRRVVPEEIDEYSHVNNTIYLKWLDGIAWAHSSALGLPLARCLESLCAFGFGRLLGRPIFDQLDAEH